MSEPNNLQEALKGKLNQEELREVGTSFDIVGDIAVIKIPDSLNEKKGIIGNALMKVHNHLRTVLRQTSPVDGEYRTRDLEVIAGKSKTETIHTEYGCSFKVDLAKVYFSPRLSNERFRITRKVTPGETVTNMFAGVGCYSILAAKHGAPEEVYSVDKNDVAVRYMRENIRINKVGGTVVPIEGDARTVIEEYLEGKSDRVLMPLPEFARDFFNSALKALKPEGGIIHFYDYGEEPKLFEPSFKFTKEKADSHRIELIESRKVRSYAPNLYHVVLDLKAVPK